MGRVRPLLWAFVFNVMMRYSNLSQKSIGELMSRYCHTHQRSLFVFYTLCVHPQHTCDNHQIPLYFVCS